MPLSKLEQDLQSGLKPVYLVVGSQSFQLEMALKRIMDLTQAGGMSELNCDSFRVGRDDLSEVVRLANSMPMLAKSRTIILHDIEKLKAKDRDSLTAYLGSPSPFTTLVLLGEKIDRRAKMSKLAGKHGLILEFKRLYESQLRPWINAIARDQQVQLDRDAVDFLVRQVGPDLSAIAKEIEKAALHAGIDQIGVDDLTAVLSAVKEQPIFNLMEAITRKNKVEAFYLLKQMLDQGESPLAILAVLGRQIRQMIIAKQLLTAKASEGELAGALGTSPFLAKKITNQARHFTQKSLRDGLLALSRYDLELKDGRCSNRAILEKLTLALCRRG